MKAQDDKKPAAGDDKQLAAAEVEQLKADLADCVERERRALADYQNLVRRTQDERMKMVKFASRSVIEAILQPLEHLSLAAAQLKDPGLTMVYQQFQQALHDEGLEEILAQGQSFDAETMEVIEKQVVEDDKQVNKVMKVVSRGYRLHGDVIQHAKVIIGSKE